MGNVKRIYKIVPAVVFVMSLLTYWFTAESGASYWDCPEYITNALLLETGHPPGNPFWILTHRVLSALPLPISGAVAVNLCSGFFTALAVALGSILALIILRMLTPSSSRSAIILNSIAAASGSLVFAWCDSIWFSAVEAEVYAMSLFLTILTLYIAVRARLAFDARRKSRLIILIAYLSGLSVGVHQLNLLVLPVVFLICRFGMRRAGFFRLAVWFVAGCVSVVIMLKGLLHGTPWMASQFELVAVNGCGMDYHSGLFIWVATILILFTATLVFAGRDKNIAAPFLFTISLIVSGVTFIGGDTISGIILGVLLALSGGIAVVRLLSADPLKAITLIWCIPVVLIGFSTYSLIMIRAAAEPPMNQGAPSDIFSFMNYLDRKQYGARPLFYGRTPESRPLRIESVAVNGHGDSIFSYNQIARTVRGPVYHRLVEGAGMPRRTGLLSPQDTIRNHSIKSGIGHGYIITDHYYDLVYTPELDTWFPRIVDGDEKSMEAYAAWTGMTRKTMQPVRITVAIDSLGNPLSHRHGESQPATALRPAPLHHFNMFMGYQLGYMYFRYLLWNFAGRQNDIPSTGESEHGNFISGIDPVDALMLGNQKEVPFEIKSGNAGRNVFYFIPFILGIAGIVILVRRGTPGKRICLFIALLFLLTGPAIVFYLNQNLGEPRERDYSFLGSFFAFSLWITVAFGAMSGALSHKRSRDHHGMSPGARKWRDVRGILGALIAMSMAVWVFAVNIDDHDRSGRTMTEDYARMILESCPKNSILFVYGDNHTFPLWYAQEVLGVRRDIMIINLSYLGSDWYLSQLASQRRSTGEPLRMTGSPADFAYGRYALVRIGNDTTVVDAVTALRDMYRMPDSSEPVLRNVRLRFADGTVYDIRERLGKYSGGYLTARQIAVLDIIASSYAGNGNARPVSWIKNIGKDQFAGMYDLTSEGLFIRSLRDSASYSARLPKLRWGGVDNGVYVDPTSGRMLSFMRRNLLRHAIRMSQNGKEREALAITDSILKGMPFSAWQSDVMEIEDSVADEETILYELRLGIGRNLGDGKIVSDAEKGVADANARKERWRRFVESLSQSDRARLSARTRQKQ